MLKDFVTLGSLELAMAERVALLFWRLHRVTRYETEAETVEEQLQNLRRERLLLEDKTLDKVSRYEAHLSRLMFKSLHELEALQVRRSGGAAPLARLDGLLRTGVRLDLASKFGRLRFAALPLSEL